MLNGQLSCVGSRGCGKIEDYGKKEGDRDDAQYFSPGTPYPASWHTLKLAKVRRGLPVFDISLMKTQKW